MNKEYKRIRKIGSKVNIKYGGLFIEQLTKNNPLVAAQVKMKLLDGIRSWGKEKRNDIEKHKEVATVESLYNDINASELELCAKAGISENEIKEVLEAVLKA